MNILFYFIFMDFFGEKESEESSRFSKGKIKRKLSEKREIGFPMSEIKLKKKK